MFPKTKKFIQRLKDIFLYYLKLFFKETSIHGLRYFVQDITLTEWYVEIFLENWKTLVLF